MSRHRHVANLDYEEGRIHHNISQYFLVLELLSDDDQDYYGKSLEEESGFDNANGNI